MIIALHGYEGDAGQLLPFTRSLESVGRVLAPEGPRPSVAYGRTVTGRSWYAMQGLALPEPTSFGDALVEVEQFLLDTLKEEEEYRGGSPPLFLLGLDQGALLSLALACIWPEVLAGVVAIAGYLPQIPGWTPEPRPMDALPILLVNDPEYRDVPISLQHDTEQALIARGAQVTAHSVAGSRALPASLPTLVNQWMKTVTG